MSCYEEAAGTIKLPAREAATFRRDLAAEANRIHERRRGLAREVYEALKGRKHADLYGAVYEYLSHRGLARDVDWAFEAITRADRPGRALAPRKPKRVAARRVELRGEDFAIVAEGREVRIRVFENNHAVENAEADALFAAAIRRLRRVRWTRGSGGTVLYQSEYTRDAFASPSARWAFGA